MKRTVRGKKAVLSYLKFGIHNACYTAIMKTKESPKTINISNGFLEQISSLYRKMQLTIMQDKTHQYESFELKTPPVMIRMWNIIVVQLLLGLTSRTALDI